MGNIGNKLNTSFQLALGDNFYYQGVQSIDDPRFQVRFIVLISSSHLHCLDDYWLEYVWTGLYQSIPIHTLVCFGW